MTDPTADPTADPSTGPGSSLLARAALALCRLDLDLVPQASRAEARELCRGQGGTFDGQRLVDLCLEGRAADGEAATVGALQRLRSRLLGEALARSRAAGGAAKVGGTIAGKLCVFLVWSIVFGVFLYLLRRNWPALDLYELGDTLVALFGG